ncbi:MAG: transposon-transfer assisting family protein [Blautia faecis]
MWFSARPGRAASRAGTFSQRGPAALPFMDEDMRPFAERTLQKISPLTENEYAELAIFAADEV